MARHELLWGKNQSMYRAAPNSVIFNPLTGMHEMILPWIGPADTETSPSLIRETIAAELERYAVTSIPRKMVKTMKLELKNLEYIQTVLYPTAFFCQSCGKLTAEDPGTNQRSRLEATKRLKEKLPKGLTCECGGRLIQWRWSTVHTCGDMIHLPTFFAAKCRKHSDKFLYFQRHGSERASSWEIACRAPGCDHRAGYPIFFWTHSKCELGDSFGTGKEAVRLLRYESAPIQKATNFIPKILKILNSDQLSSLPRPGTRDASALALGSLRAEGYFSHLNLGAGMDSWIERFEPKGAVPDATLQLALEVAKTIKDKAERDKMIAALTPTSKTGGILEDSDFERLVQRPDYLSEAAAISAYQRRNNSVEVSDLLADPTTHRETARQLEEASRMATRMKILGLRHVEEITLTSCLVGYTRGDYDPARVILQFYVDQKSSGAVSYRVYNNTVKTEGIFIQLNPSSVLEWVSRATGQEAAPTGDFSTDLFHLQKKYNPAVRMFQGPEDPWSRTYYRLLHTISHLLIRALGQYSGLEQEGLTEKIYPFQSAILVFSNQNTEFSLGGLAMAFEHHLNDVFESMMRDAEVCPYNPECETSYGACPACIYVAEISCENFNRPLDRKLVSSSRENSFWR